jgi:hypothetical protein
MRYVARHFLCHFLGVGKAPTDVCYDSQVLKESGVSNFELREDFYLEHRTSEQTIFEVRFVSAAIDHDVHIVTILTTRR